LIYNDTVKWKKVCFNRCIKGTEYDFYSVIGEIFIHRVFVIHCKIVRVDLVGVPQCVSKQKTLRVDLTNIFVKSTLSTVQIKCHTACWFNAQSLFFILRIRVESTTKKCVQISRRVSKSHAWCVNHTHACGIVANQNPIWIFLVILL
jgi:hypothetical protein